MSPLKVVEKRPETGIVSKITFVADGHPFYITDIPSSARFTFIAEVDTVPKAYFKVQVANLVPGGPIPYVLPSELITCFSVNHGTQVITRVKKMPR